MSKMNTGSLTRALCALLFVCAAAPALAMPKQVRASYQGYMNGIPIGIITENFVMDGDKYRIDSDTKATGVASLFQRQPMKLYSVGHVTRDGLKPTQFEGRRSPDEDPRVSAKFDWSGGRLHIKHDGKEESFPIQPGMQDRLSIMYQLMFWPMARMNQVEFSLTNGRKLDHYRYKINQEVELTTPLGKVKTLHLVKQHAPGETGTEIWLSLQHQYFPVKVVYIEKDGVRFEQFIKTLEIRD
jgi:hypothetical protein